jgi:hypothetical protein
MGTEFFELRDKVIVFTVATFTGKYENVKWDPFQIKLSVWLKHAVQDIMPHIITNIVF